MIKQKKIIIIDDDEKNIFALSAVLNAKGFLCEAASNGTDGFKKILEQKDIYMALIDMMMPEMDGYLLMKTIRETPALKHFPLVAVTAQAMVGDMEKCLQAGANNYISKPVDIEALIKIIKQHLKEK